MSATTKDFVIKVIPMGAVRSNGRKSMYHSKNGSRVSSYVSYKKTIAWELKKLKVEEIPSEIEYLRFYMPIPNTKLKKYRDRVGKLHTQKPDLDNLMKAFLDANGKEDSHIAAINGGLKKIWCLPEETRIEFGIKK